jgi:methylmalonyl-CoA carboxyltransferase large subunit
MAKKQEALELIAERLGALLDRLDKLDERMARLEQEVKAAAPPPADDVSEELALVIAAAVAAYLGKRPRIRQIRLLGSAAWAQQGRVSIQASHGIVLQHGV